MILNTANTNSVAMSLPVIARRLEIGRVNLEWLVSGYCLSSGCLLLIFGRIADLYGRKKVFIAGSIWLAVLSLGCSFTKSGLALDILRGLQGVGAAATIPASFGTLAQTFPEGRARSIAFAAFAAGAPTGAVLGNIFGGLLTQLTRQSWHSVFYLNSALSVVSLVGALMFFNKDPPSIETDRYRQVDWIGGLLVTSGLVLLVFVLSQGQVAPQKWATLYHNSVNTRVAAYLAAMKYLPSPPPLMYLSLWTRAHGRIAVVMCISLLNRAAFMGWVYWAVLYYQEYIGLTPIETAIRLLPMFFVGIALNIVFAGIVSRVPMVVLVAFGTCLTACSSLLFAFIDPKEAYWAFGFPASILSVIGADFVFASGTLFVAKFSLKNQQSVSGAVFQTMTQLGTSIGVTTSTLIFDRALGESGDQHSLLDAYKASQWGNFTLGMIATALALVFLRKVGIIEQTPPKLQDSDDGTGAKEQHQK
ncbi:hypothetical protein VKT23_011650 [Stygiomarasmius scandens]|uniref:Major facilitator superfamily (MFS) profile domain-containing protein n=1 Tax=Marasmiellus scandens TaxID=2682957 RepID=A0ABR1J8J5_9AGAR